MNYNTRINHYASQPVKRITLTVELRPENIFDYASVESWLQINTISHVWHDSHTVKFSTTLPVKSVECGLAQFNGKILSHEI